MNEYKSFDKIPAPPSESAPGITNRDRIVIHKPRLKETVVNSSHIKWKPVDKVAARVVAPATGYSKPPRPEPRFEKKESEMSMQFPEKAALKTRRHVNDQGYVEDMINAEDAAPLAIMHHEERIKEGIKSGEELVARAHSVVDACDYLVHHIHEPFGEYQEWIKKQLQSTREQRLAMESETRQLMAALKEVRGFFLNKDYELERARLAEFIGLCERLRDLKESGFLDTVAETMLNLAEETPRPRSRR